MATTREGDIRAVYYTRMLITVYDPVATQVRTSPRQRSAVATMAVTKVIQVTYVAATLVVMASVAKTVSIIH